MPVGGTRAIFTAVLVCALAIGTAQPVSAEATGPRTASPPRATTPPDTVPPENTDPDSDWGYAEHAMANSLAPAATGTSGPTNAASQNLPYHLGPVIVHPSVYLIFWGPQWKNGSLDKFKHVEADTSRYVSDFFNGVGGSPWLNSVTQYYCIGDAILAFFGNDCSQPGTAPGITNPRNLVISTIYDPTPIDPKKLDDKLLRKRVRTWWQQEHNNSNAIYFMFTPSGFLTSDFPAASCGFHGWEQNGLSHIWFSYIPYASDLSGCYTNFVNTPALGTTSPYKQGSPYNDDGTLDGFTITGGHELGEAITDPAILGPKVNLPHFGPTNAAVPAWITLDGNENGDLCKTAVGPWDTPYGNIWLPAVSDGRYHAFAVQALWSQADHGCPLGYPVRAVVPDVDNGPQLHTAIDVMNRGSATNWFSIQYFDTQANGAASASQLENSVGFGDGNEALRPNATWSVTQAADHHSVPDGGTGTAVVYGLEPVEVTIRQSAGSGHDPSGYAAVRPGAGTATALTAADIDYDGNPPGQPGDPAAQTNTGVSVINSGATRTNVSVQFRDPAGFVRGTAGPYLLHAGAGINVSPNGAGIQGVFKGTATITSGTDSTDQSVEQLPVAAAVTIDRKPNDALSTYLATPASGPFGDATTLRAPLLYGQPPPPPTPNGPAPLSYRTLAAGNDFGLAIKTDGTVLAWGGNEAGQLGNAVDVSPGSSPAPSGSPVPVRDGTGTGLLSGVVSVQAGASYSLALKSDGTVWGWGADSNGQLGNGGTTNVSIPTQVVGPAGSGLLTNIVSIAAGDRHAWAVRSDGTVWTWGYDGNGELGDNGTCRCIFSTTPVQVVSPSGSGFFQDAVAAAPGYGASHSAVIRKDGTVWAWGDNFAYQSGRTTSPQILVPTEIFGPGGAGFLQGVVEASAGYGFNVVLRADGTAWGWGDSLYHQLGTNLDSFDPFNARFPVLLAGDVVAMTAGLNDTELVKSDGSVLVEGSNQNGEAGFVDSTRQDVKVLTAVAGVTGVTGVAAGDSFGFAVTSTGNVWAWGNNQAGALGRGTVPACLSCSNPQPPALVVSDSGVGPLAGIQTGSDITVSAQAIARLAAGQQFSLAVTSTGTVVAWGADNRGQLGNNNNQPVGTPVAIPGLSRVIAVAAGGAHSLALTEQGTVYAWGFNGEGELGLGDTNDRSSPTVVPGLPPIVAITAGLSHSLALDSTGQVWAWGFNGDGELGDGTTSTRLSPEAVPNLIVEQIAGGLNFSIAIDQVGRVLTWGANDYGQLGDGTTTPSLVPQPVPGLPSIAQIAAGLRESYALDFQGQLYAWGLGQSGELGNGQTGLSADSHSPTRVVGTDGVTPLTGVQVVTSGFGSRAFALMGDGTVLGWGSSPNGELGTGSAGSGTPARVLGGAGGPPFGPVRAIGVGYQHTVAVEPDGSGWSWGDNTFGELGSGSPAASAPFPAPIPALPGVAGLPAGGGGGAPPQAFTSRLVLADPGDASAAVTVTYVSATGVSTTIHAAIPAHSQAVIDQASAAGPPTSPTPYSATVTSDHPLSAVAEILPTAASSARATAYNLFAAGGSATGAPLVAHAGPDGLSTVLYVMGVDGSPVQATVTYLDGIGVAIKSVTLTVPSTGVAMADQSVDVAAGTVSSATVTVAGGGQVAVLEVGTGDTGLSSVSLP